MKGVFEMQNASLEASIVVGCWSLVFSRTSISNSASLKQFDLKTY